MCVHRHTSGFVVFTPQRFDRLPSSNVHGRAPNKPHPCTHTHTIWALCLRSENLRFDIIISCRTWKNVRQNDWRLWETYIHTRMYIYFFSENDNSHAAYRSTRVRFRDQFNARAINRSRRRIFDSSFVKHYASGVVIEKPTGLYCAATRTHDIVVGRYIDQRHIHDTHTHTHTRSSAAEPSRFFLLFQSKRVSRCQLS